MNIPKQFKCAGFTINVVIKDSLEDNSYGNYCDATNTISIAKTVKVNDKVIKLTERQMFNTFFHEVVHVWQFYYDNQYDEAQAQSYANFMCEFETTQELDVPF